MSKKVIGVAVVVLVAFGTSYFVARQNSKVEQPNESTATSKPSGITLDLSGQQLTSLPESMLSRSDITVLNLSNNQLTALPANITRLTNLVELNVENNRLETLPSEISLLKNLRKLRVDNNRITTLPVELGTMTWLEQLDLSNNRLPESQLDQIKSRLTETEVKT